MMTVDKLLPQGTGLAPVLIARAACVALSWDVRQKSRFDAVDSLGRSIGVFLPRGATVRGGDVLVAEDGSLIRVAAAAQPVLVVRQDPAHGAAFDLMRAAYHLGNRHVQLELQPDHLKLEPDHVLAAMLRGMGLRVTEESGPFEPEAGAYSSHHATRLPHDAHDEAGHGPRAEAHASAGSAHVHGQGCAHHHHHR